MNPNNPNCKSAFLEILQGAGEGHRVGEVILNQSVVEQIMV